MFFCTITSFQRLKSQLFKLKLDIGFYVSAFNMDMLHRLEVRNQEKTMIVYGSFKVAELSFCTLWIQC